MRYDPIKKMLGHIFNQTPLSRVIFYNLLDMLLLRSWYIRRELTRWERDAPPGTKVLDAGSGFGQYVWRIAKSNNSHNITGIDLKQEQVDDCNRFFEGKKMNNRVVFKMADLTLLEDQEKYDLALAVDVMEHIPDDIKVLTNLCNSLKPGGILLISTPSDKGGSCTTTHGDSPTGFIDEHVRDGYNMDELGTKLERAGFSKVESKYSYGWPGSLAWVLTMKIPITLLNKSKIFLAVLPFYYLVVFPPSLVLNYIDLSRVNEVGTGLIVKATK